MYVYVIFWGVSLALACLIRSKLAQFIFVGAVFVFVGLRFETGFDWPTFKAGFDFLQGNFSIDGIQWYAELFQIELGYALVAGIAGQIFPEYEYFQALVTFAFLASIVSLCRAFHVRNVAIVIALAATFLLLPLMMSTLRQCLAMSIFNFALSAAVDRRRISMIALSILSMTIHVSTLFYIVALIFAFARPLQLPTLRGVALMVIAGNAAVFSLALITDFLPAHLADRVAFYRLDQIVENISLWQLYFVILSVFIATYTIFGTRDDNLPDKRVTFLGRVIVSLAVMCMCTVTLNVVRDRISYEMFLLFALYTAHRDGRLAFPAQGVTAALGLFFSIFNLLSPINRIVFVPYQNVIGISFTGDEGDGSARQDAFQREFNKSHQP